ncbi:two component transcriptional regulator, LuxR family [Kribbella flavida DSM 17836]|uniref:Two component transcriptional regulator, LuxR family n=1 Tax=Kribbella flavida (strain DSM 17836 / JCM 10339 / NBRC 14399) TaxID=479435 RepID=D2PQT6_KRIFD|nr:response regulator transcription factor [Kribbella flavida]ADB31069.1 two component transcriptional regulator, LuxR family [Kribbella flavida DSM 17836]
MAEGRTRILIADDQERVRIGFRLILDSQPDMQVVAEAADGAEALRAIRTHRPDIVLTDIRMPHVDGLELTRQVTAATFGVPVKVIVITTFEVDEYVHTALQHGASGFLLKRSGPNLLVEAVRAAVSGDTLISPQVTVRLLEQLRHRRSGPLPDKAALTDREREITMLVGRGLSNAEIATELFISVGTVKTHVANIQRKLSARSRVGIAAWAWQTGQLPL